MRQKYKYLKNESGFTLIEVLLTLFIAGLLISFPVMSFESAQENVELDIFFEEVTTSIRLMQNYAILYNVATTVQVQSDFNRIYFRANNPQHELTHSIYFPESVSSPTRIRDIRFKSGTGNNSEISSWKFDTSQGIYELKFRIGSGRFEFEKVN